MIILPAPAADTDAYAPVVNIPFLVPVESGQFIPFQPGIDTVATPSRLHAV